MFSSASFSNPPRSNQTIKRFPARTILHALVVAITLALPLDAISEGGASIGVFFDVDGSTCEATVGEGETLTAYIYFFPGALTGTVRADFGVNGLPEGWEVDAQPNPDAQFAVDTPVATEGAGAAIGFASCQRDSPLLLYTVFIRTTSEESDVRLTVDPHVSVNWWPFCPRIGCACWSTCFRPICADGGQAFINSTSGGSCTVVAVEPKTWENVKALYR
jgi:hypothetical protein